ncbi:general stress protein [Leptolyngbya sp. FACHB-36]|uniref:general stress protein n=1 Tax=Leptolyngbya sp. FACHB-36 TaxID=2692808 RepID=UPI0018F0173D|nr:general stress protein [Leptolyngbya sp. FACHB-36]
MDRVSIIARDGDRQGDIAGTEVSDSVKAERSANHVGSKADDGAKVGAVSGGAIGGITGLLVGLGLLAIPGIGPVMLAGAQATILATTLAGGAIGAATGGLVGALIGLGIPEERAKVYHDRVARGDYLLMLEGSDAELARAETILYHCGVEEYGVYDLPNSATVAHTAPASVSMVSPIAPSSGIAIERSKYAIGFFANEVDADQAIRVLRTASFPLNQVTLVARTFDRRQAFAGVDLRGRLEAMRLGLPAERARFYNDQMAQGSYVIVINGTEAEVQRAESILTSRRPHEWGVYDPTLIGSAESVTPTPTIAYDRDPRPATVNVGPHKRAIGVFANSRDVKAALTDLRDSGFSMNQVSVIAKDTNQPDRLAGVETTSRPIKKAEKGAKTGAVTGGALGGLGGLLVGLGALAIPGVGPVILGGAAATALATAVSGSVIGAAAGGLAGGLVGVGIPEDRAKLYNDQFERGDYLVLVDGTEDELRRAEAILNRRGIRDWGIFDAVSGSTPRTRDSATVDSATVTERKPNVTVIDRRHEAR